MFLEEQLQFNTDLELQTTQISHLTVWRSEVWNGSQRADIQVSEGCAPLKVLWENQCPCPSHLLEATTSLAHGPFIFRVSSYISPTSAFIITSPSLPPPFAATPLWLHWAHLDHPGSCPISKSYTCYSEESLCHARWRSPRFQGWDSRLPKQDLSFFLTWQGAWCMGSLHAYLLSEWRNEWTNKWFSDSLMGAFESYLTRDSSI